MYIKSKTENELLELRCAIEQSEVILNNLMQLTNADKTSFSIPFDDVFVTMEVVLKLLRDTSS